MISLLIMFIPFLDNTVEEGKCVFLELLCLYVSKCLVNHQTEYKRQKCREGMEWHVWERFHREDRFGVDSAGKAGKSSGSSSVIASKCCFWHFATTIFHCEELLWLPRMLSFSGPCMLNDSSVSMSQWKSKFPTPVYITWCAAVGCEPLRDTSAFGFPRHRIHDVKN